MAPSDESFRPRERGTTNITVQSGDGPSGEEAFAVWAIRNWKTLAGVLALFGIGSGSGFKALEQLEIAAEDRIIRRQAEESQAKEVRSNGQQIQELSERVAKVEASVAQHEELTKTGVELIMLSPKVMRALDRNPELRARAAKAVRRK